MTNRVSIPGLLLILIIPAWCQEPRTSPAAPDLPPFLDQFRTQLHPPVVQTRVSFSSAVGPVAGQVVRFDNAEPLPAILLLNDVADARDWMSTNARELASIGYLVLLLDRSSAQAAVPGKLVRSATELADEKTLAGLSAAVRWLRQRKDVLPDRLGVVGWAAGGNQALALAASTPLQACVVCDSSLCTEPGWLAGLRGTCLLGIFSGLSRETEQNLSAFRRALTGAHIEHKLQVFNASPGFMNPARTTYSRTPAEEAWFEIYEYLGRFVEDAPDNHPLMAHPGAKLTRQQSIATIADVMRAVNSATGVRATLIRGLEQAPKDAHDWNAVRASAAILGEAGRLLQAQRPPHGTMASWEEQVREFTTAARKVVSAADRHDLAAARLGLQEVTARCATCHKLHR